MRHSTIGLSPRVGCVRCLLPRQPWRRSLYWRDRSVRFHEYDRVPAAMSVEDLLAEGAST